MSFEEFQDGVQGYNFSNSESLCCSNASHQVLAQSQLRSFKLFQDAAMVAILDMGTEQF